MQNLKFRTIAIVFLVVALALAMWGIYYTFSFDTSGIVKEHVVDYDKLGLRVLIRANTVGIGGSMQIKIIACPANNKSRYIETSNRELIKFNDSELYYKKQNESTLVLYVSSEGIPKNQKTGELSFGKLTIILNELKGGERKKYELKYKEYGLEKIDLYE